MNIQDILRASSVTRWHIVATSREQNLAEHSFNVAMISRAICKELGIDDTTATKLALEHDLDEIIYGDIPSHTKKKLGINPPYKAPQRDIDSCIIVRVADLLDAVLFIKRYHTDRHGIEVWHMLEGQWLDSMESIGPSWRDAASRVRRNIEDGPIEI